MLYSRSLELLLCKGFPDGSAEKNPPANAGDAGSVPGWARSPGEGNGTKQQPLCNCNFMCLVTQLMADSVRPHGLWPASLLCPRNFPGKNTGKGCLLQTVTSYHWTMSPLTSFPPSSGDHHSTVSSILLPILYSLKIKCL